MLALTTYKFICHFCGWIVIISYKRGLLFYYWCMGVCRYLQRDNRQHARVFFMPVHNHSRGVLSPFVELVVGFLNSLLLTINYLRL